MTAMARKISLIPMALATVTPPTHTAPPTRTPPQENSTAPVSLRAPPATDPQTRTPVIPMDQARLTPTVPAPLVLTTTALPTLRAVTEMMTMTDQTRRTIPQPGS